MPPATIYGQSFEQLKALLLDWMGVSTTRLSNSAAGSIINIVQREICRLYELSHNEYSDTFTTAAGTYDYTKPVGFSKPFSMYYISSTQSQIIFLNGPLPKSDFDTVYPDPTVQGDAVNYCVWGSKIRLGYCPSSVYTVYRNYYRILPDLTDDSNNVTNQSSLTQNAWEVLLFNALVYTSQYLIEDSRINVWVPKAGSLLQALVREDARARSIGRAAQSQEPGTLAPYPFWFNVQATP